MHHDDAPLVSVLLPVFDGGAFLEECLESLAAQSLREFEVVAVDDGSQDESAQILERWARRDPRFRVLRRPHRGLIVALNDGLAACRGRFVARMDADDLAHPERLELQTRALLAPNGPDICSCLVEHFPEQNVGQGFRIYESWLNSLIDHDQILCERFIESPLPHPSAMAPRRVFVDAGGYRDEGWPEDYDLWLRLAAHGYRFAKVPKVLLRWRQHEDRLTRTDSRYAVERFLECKAQHLVDGPLLGAGSVIVWGGGQTGRRLSKHLLRRQAPIEAFIDIDPRKIGGTLRGRPVHEPADLTRLLGSTERSLVLAAVSSRGAREIIRQYLGDLGLREAEHFWCVA